MKFKMEAAPGLATTQQVWAVSEVRDSKESISLAQCEDMIQNYLATGILRINHKKGSISAYSSSVYTSFRRPPRTNNFTIFLSTRKFTCR